MYLLVHAPYVSISLNDFFTSEKTSQTVSYISSVQPLTYPVLRHRWHRQISSYYRAPVFLVCAEPESLPPLLCRSFLWFVVATVSVLCFDRRLVSWLATHFLKALGYSKATRHRLPWGDRSCSP